MTPSGQDCFLAGFQRILENSKKFTQSSVAHYLNVSKAYLNDMIKNRRKISPHNQDQIAELFGTTPEGIMAMGRAILTGDAMPDLPDHELEGYLNMARQVLTSTDESARIALRSNIDCFFEKVKEREEKSACENSSQELTGFEPDEAM